MLGVVKLEVQSYRICLLANGDIVFGRNLRAYKMIWLSRGRDLDN